MKKLALLLAALSVASVSYAKEVVPTVEPVVVEEPVVAAPALVVTSVGQYIEVDNTAGSADGDIGVVHFGNKVNLKLGDDWAFGLHARKSWTASSDDTFDSTTGDLVAKEGMDGSGHRLEVSATRLFDGFTLGTKWRGEQGFDRFYLMGSYNMGMFSGSGYVSYTSADGTKDGKQNDKWYAELTPISFNLGPVKTSWYAEIEEGAGSSNDYGWQQNQIRLSANVYEGDKLTLTPEVRYGVYSGDTTADTEIVPVLNVAYKMTEHLTLDGYYLYELREDENNVDTYYGEFCMGWTYKF